MKRMMSLLAAPVVALIAPSAIVSPAFAQGNPASRSAPVDCDRACMESLVERVLDAMVARDVSQLPLASTVRVTENGIARPVWDGLWKTASARGRYKLHVVDSDHGQAAFIGSMIENGVPVYLVLRIAVREQKIAEIETIVARAGAAGPPSPTAGEYAEQRGTPRPALTRAVPTGERMSRADLTRVADSYFAHLQGNDGRRTANFADSCLRLENGRQTNSMPRSAPAGQPDILAMDCTTQIGSGFFAFVTGIRDRRYPIVDRERGLVLSFSFWDHSGAVPTVTVSGKHSIKAPFLSPKTLHIAELFQIDKGRIDQIEAVENTVPYGMRSDYWDE